MRSVLMRFVVVFMTIFGFKLVVTSCHKKSLTLNYTGDLNLAAVFPIHKSGENGACDKIQKEDGIQPLEAMLFTLDEINSNNNILPGVKLGAIAIDSCDNPIQAAEKTLPLLKCFMREKVDYPSCEDNDQQWNCGDGIVGILGPQTSAVSLEIASLGRLLSVPLISYLSSAVTLCQRDNFPNFFRTVPSDIHQALAIVALLERFEWNYASFVHSDSVYGTTGYELVKQAVEKTNNICLADPVTIYNKQFKDEDYVRVVRTLVKGKNDSTLAKGKNENKVDNGFVTPKVVIVFADRVPAGKLLQAAKDEGVKDNFLWIGSDAWASRESVVENKEEFVEGAIAIHPLRRNLPAYNEYFQRLINTKNERNPWFEEYLEVYHNCSSDTGKTDRSNCNEGTQRAEREQVYVHFVRDAVYAYAHALHDLHLDLCGSFVGNKRLCPAFKENVFKNLTHYLSKVSFNDTEDNFTFRFYSHDDSYSAHSSVAHDGPPRYSIINFAENQTIYDWRTVGTYIDGEIKDIDDEFPTRYQDMAIEKVCNRKECEVNHIKIPDTDDQCCWHCQNCGNYKIAKNQYECIDCALGNRSEISSTDKTVKCVRIEESYMDYSSPWAIGSMSVAGIGILLTFGAVQVFWQFWGTPFVKACGRDLSLIMLCGNFCSFLTTFIIVAKPTPVTCGLMRFGVGFCYTVCYASVVVKTNRVWRIFNANGPIHPRFTNSFSSTMIVLALVTIEVLINTVWLLFELPDTRHVTDIPGKNILVCNGVDTQIMTGLIYPFLLILIATVYAFLTRKVPGGFNETKFIFFANTLTSIHWFAYVPLYLASAQHEIRPFILAFSLSVSGFVQLGCLIFPKLYTVVFKPDENTKLKVMKPHRSRATFTVPETPPNSVAVGMADGALLGPYQHMVAPQEVKVEFQQQDHVQTSSNLSSMQSHSSANRRHPTWSHELNTFEKRPRSRSLSVSRATQTREELEQIREITQRNSPHVQFTVESVADEEDDEYDKYYNDGNVQLKVPNNTDL